MALKHRDTSDNTTLDGFIRAYNAEDLRIDKLHLQEVVSDKTMSRKLIINTSSILDKYLEELAKSISSVKLSMSEYYKYRWNPKLFSYDVYETTELWFLVMMANELYAIPEFDLKVVKYYSPEVVNKINRIIDLEEIFKKQNAEEIDAEFK